MISEDFAKVYVFIEMKDPHDSYTQSLFGPLAKVSLGQDDVIIDYFPPEEDPFSANYHIGRLEDEEKLLNLLLLRAAKRKVQNSG